MAQRTRLSNAIARLKAQIGDITVRTSAKRVLSAGPPQPQEMLSYIIANQVCVMMALVDLLETLDGVAAETTDAK